MRPNKAYKLLLPCVKNIHVYLYVYFIHRNFQMDLKLFFISKAEKSQPQKLLAAHLASMQYSTHIFYATFLKKMTLRLIFDLN